MSWKSTTIAAMTLVAGLTVSNLGTGYLVDWLWFSSLGYGDVFWTIFGTRLLLFLTALGTTALIVWVNGLLATRLAPSGASRQLIHLVGAVAPPSLAASDPYDVLRRRATLVVACTAVVAGTVVAAFEMTNWETVLRFVYEVPYGQRGLSGISCVAG